MARFALLLGLLAAFGPLSIDMYLPALPAIGVELGGGIAGAQLTLAAFFAGMAAGQLLHGPLADRFGRRPPLFAGLVGFILASLGCALAPDNGALTAARFLQAFAGCAGMVISRAVVRDLSDRMDPVRMMGRLMLVMGVAPILAPLLGGWVQAALGWRAIFFFLAGVGALALVLCALFLPETLPGAQRRAEGVAGALRSYGRLLRDRRFQAAALPGALAIMGMFAYIAGSPFVFIELHGVPAERYGLLFGGAAAGIIGASQLAGRLAALWGREALMTRALGVLAVVALLLLAATALGGALPLIYAPVWLYVALMGLVLPMAGVLSIQPFPQMAGTASALMGTMQFALGAVAGTAISALHDGTGFPMAGMIALAAVLALLARLALRPREA
ncbi:multidrug effflux MFS transporter [Sabulicella glaciei]|uniref:Bcr/CflA family efflux transporter n=1 Tax=Sabulicella glaciei TaxID=2984948 RepID=A0ABT3NWL2_9PROT|nr:multidrug effflux MFS transporter [Roseococcus sp. MDT2-1-1]MCW8086565.1 multidrug effflux MFS transporter [Roseococcus sp. MDT2-1-1]